MKYVALNEIEHSHGTVQLLAEGSNLKLKQGTSIVLLPQPTNDPNDPLNWPYIKRVAAFWSILWLSALINFMITGLAPGFGLIIQEFEISVTEVTWLVSACLVAQFFSCYTIAPWSVRFGMRPIWLICTLVFVLCNVWAAVAKSYTSLLLSRMCAAYAATVSEPLSVQIVHDIFFLHERGTQSGVQAIWLCLGSSLAPVVSGFLIERQGWRWFHWLVTIMGGIDLVLIFLLTPETQYHRDLHRALDVACVDEDEVISGKENPSTSHGEGKPAVQATEQVESRTAIPPKKTYLEQLKPWSRVNRDSNLLGAFARPWATWCYPSVVWTILSFSIHISCVVVLISVIPIYLGAPPYNFTISQQGLVFIGPILGNCFGSFFCGYLNDKLSQWSTKRNHGVFEPEMRLPVTIFPAVLVPVGLLMFGIGVAKGVHWAVPVIGAGMVGTAITGIPAVAEPYLMDSYAPVIFDCLVSFNGFKNLVAFGIGFGVVPWIERNGVVAVFVILAVLVLVIDASVIFIYIWGKRLRQRDARLKVLIF